MNTHFNRASLQNGDSYVVDYTHDSGGERGVEITPEVPIDGMPFLHLCNPRRIEYWSVNFEQHDGFFWFTDENDIRKKVQNCECMFVASRARRKGWMLLAELKYPESPDAVERNSQSAYLQLLNTLSWLADKDVANANNHRIYLNVSIPEYSIQEPFTSFLFSQDDLLEGSPDMFCPAGSKLLQDLKGKGFEIHVLGFNSVLIYTDAHIMLGKGKV